MPSPKLGLKLRTPRVYYYPRSGPHAETPMKTIKTETRPEHQVTGRDYPGEWARQIELYLDKEPRRLVFFGGLFCGFVLLFIIASVLGAFK
jgi:hypothetical protein